MRIGLLDGPFEVLLQLCVLLFLVKIRKYAKAAVTTATIAVMQPIIVRTLFKHFIN